MTEFFNRTKQLTTKKHLAIYFVIIFIILSFIAGYFAGEKHKVENTIANGQAITSQEYGEVNGKDAIPEYLTKDANFNLFWDVWKLIQKKYVDRPVGETKMMYGAIAGLVASLGDPYSMYFDPETADKFTKELSGTFDGIGAEIAYKNDNLVIVAPLPGTPAQKAGLKAGDKIIGINNLDTRGMAVDYAVSIIRGEKGTEVTLLIMRDGFDKPKEYKIVRDTIKVDSVKWEMKKTGQKDIAYVTITTFNDDTEESLNKAIGEILAKNPDGIILNLRDDPGGYLNTAVSVASEWVDKGELIVTESHDSEKLEYKSEKNPRFKGFKTIVLINEGSASASEIVAGALKDHKLATLIGEKSFGKGTVQSLEPLSDGSVIKLTIAKWLTPNGTEIQKKGIEPDIAVELTKDDFNNDKDPQLDKALAEFNEIN